MYHKLPHLLLLRDVAERHRWLALLDEHPAILGHLVRRQNALLVQSQHFLSAVPGAGVAMRAVTATATRLL